MKRQITAAEYHAINANSASLLKAARKGAPHLRRYLEGTQTFGPAVALGTAAHPMLLTPADFYDEIAVAPDVNRRTKAGREEYAAWLEFERYADGLQILQDVRRHSGAGNRWVDVQSPAAARGALKRQIANLCSASV